MQTIGDRIKIIRTNGNLSQEDFGNAIMLSRSQIASFETNRREVSERTIRDICREFNVNELWLKNGIGDMYLTPEQDTLLAKALADITISENEILRDLAIKLVQLDEPYLDHINGLIDGLLKNNQKKSK